MRISDWSSDVCSSDLKAAFTSDRFNFQGGEYVFNEKRTQIGLWNAELKDIYSQQYLNLIHSQPLGDWTLGANLGFFYGKDDGSARAGELDNKTWSGMFSARYGGNTFYVGLQTLTGDRAWMRVNGTSGRSEERRGGKACVSTWRSR